MCPREHQKDCDWKPTDKLVWACLTCGLADHQGTRIIRAMGEAAVKRQQKS
jgi:hypothetical protein